jgi:hypothetical protein
MAQKGHRAERETQRQYRDEYKALWHQSGRLKVTDAWQTGQIKPTENGGSYISGS